MKIFKFTDFTLSDYGMIMDEKKFDKNEIGDSFFVSYFGGAYREKFTFKRALILGNSVEHLYRSENGNRALFSLKVDKFPIVSYK